MAAAEEEARQKVLKELKEKNDMIINIKERKNDQVVAKYYDPAASKWYINAREFDKEGSLPLHVAAREGGAEVVAAVTRQLRACC